MVTHLTHLTEPRLGAYRSGPASWGALQRGGLGPRGDRYVPQSGLPVSTLSCWAAPMPCAGPAMIALRVVRQADLAEQVAQLSNATRRSASCVCVAGNGTTLRVAQLTSALFVHFEGTLLIRHQRLKHAAACRSMPQNATACRST